MKRAKLMAARYSKGWSQEKLAEKVSVTRNTVSAWERGTIDPYPIHVQSLYNVFAMSAEDLDLVSSDKEMVSNYVWLHQPEQALPALQRALTTISPTALRRRARLYADMSYAHAQLGDVKQACSFAEQALDIAVEVQSISTLQRLQVVKDELKPWKNKAEVKNLKRQFTDTVLTFANTKETV